MADTTFVNNATPIVADWLNDVNNFLYEELVSAKRYGAVGDGTTDDTAAIQAGLTALSGTNKYLYLTNGTYLISSALTVPTRTGLVGDGSAILYASSSGFSNTDPDTYGTSTSTVLNLSGQTSSPYTPNYNQKIIGLKIRYQFLQGRVCNAIAARNCYNVDISYNEIYDFPLSKVIVVASLRGASKITNNYIHDITSNTVFSGYGYPERGFVNITGIDVDDDAITDGSLITSDDLLIFGNHIENLNHGATAIATYGNQADGINLQKGNGIRVIGNKLVNSSEGIDTFSSGAYIAGNTVLDMTEFGIKLIHGADRTRVHGNKIQRAGLAGITVVGGLSSEGDVFGNIVSDNIINDIDPSNLHNGATTACIKLENQATTSVARDNYFVNNVLTPGTYGEYLIVNNTSGDVNNVFDRNIITGAGTDGTYLVLAANNFDIIPHISTKTQVTSSTQAIATGAAAKVAFNSAVIDRLSEFDVTTNNRWVCTHPGYYLIDFQVSMQLCRGLYVHIYKNGSVIASVAGIDSATDVVQAGFNRFLVYMSVADYLEGWVQHASGANRNVIAGVANTSFTVLPA